MGGDLVRVRPATATDTRQRLPSFVGISAETAGASGICMHRVEIPPGGQAEPHCHLGFETAIYLIQGRVETRYGEALEKSVVNEAGDFLFIPAGIVHRPRNLSLTETAIAIVARNDPREQENVRLCRLGRSARQR